MSQCSQCSSTLLIHSTETSALLSDAPDSFIASIQEFAELVSGLQTDRESSKHAAVRPGGCKKRSNFTAASVEVSPYLEHYKTFWPFC